MTTASFSVRLEELYKVLSSYEKRELSRYLDSPFFNRDKNLLPLHLCLSDADSFTDKFKAWKAVFKSARFSEKKFRYLVSDLIAAIEEFIFVSALRKSRNGYIHALDEFFSAREAPVNKAVVAAKIKSGASAGRGTLSPEQYLEQHYKSELLEEMHMTSFKQYARYVQESNKSEPGGIDLFYIIEKLRQACLVANNNNIFGIQIKSWFQAEVLELAAQKRFKANPFIKAYHSVYLMLTEKEEEHYFSLKKIIDDYGYEFDDKNLAELFIYARNFCIGKINAGRQEFYKELFSLYEQGLSKRVLLLNGEINERNFKNIVTTGLRIGKQQWVFDFIHAYRYKLNTAVRDSAFNYNLANYFFHTGKFDKALQSLQKVSLADLFYGLDARSLTLKCYYELDEHEAFFNAYESFRVFVGRRKNVSEQHRKNYLNFLRIAKKLMNLRPRDKKNIERIKQEISSTKALADKNWLEAKMKVFTE